MRTPARFPVPPRPYDEAMALAIDDDTFVAPPVTEPPLDDVLTRLASVVRELADIELHDESDAALTDALTTLARLRESIHASTARVAAVWDRRRVWAGDGAKSPSAWLARATRLPKQECGSLVWLSRSFRVTPRTAAAWQIGDISAAHVRKLRSLRNPRTLIDFDRDEPMLLDQARRLTYRQFEAAADYWLLHADPDGADASSMEQRALRRVSLDETVHGMYSGSVLLDPVGGLILHAELARLEQSLFNDDWTEACTRLGREPTVFELARTPDQRRADALVLMATRSTAASPGASTKPLFTVVVGSESLRWLCELGSGRVVAPSALQPWLDDAQLESILFDEAGRRAIEVSRRRLFRGALRRIVEVRDRQCFHEWCDEPAARCQVDHIEPHAVGGMTDQRNGRLACGFHNRLRHQRRPRAPATDEDG